MSVSDIKALTFAREIRKEAVLLLGGKPADDVAIYKLTASLVLDSLAIAIERTVEATR